MDKILELRRQIKTLLDRITAIEDLAKAEDRDMNDTEYTEFQGISEQLERIQKQIDILEKVEAQRKELAKPTETPVNQETKIEVIDETDDFKSFGEFLQSVARAALPRGTYIENIECGYVDRRLSEPAKEARAAQQLNEAQPAAGGFLLRKDFLDVILGRIYDEMIFASKARKFAISTNANGIKIPYIDETDRADGKRWGGIRAYWMNEAGAFTGTKPKLGMMNMDLEKIGAITYMTDELMQDASVLSGLIKDKFPEEIAFKVDDAILNGDGSAKPFGILNASNVLVSITKETNQTADTIVSENIFKMYSRLWPRSLKNAVWFANIDTFPQLATLSIAVGSGGVPLWVPGNSIAGVPYNTLMGKPLIFTEFNATVGTVGDIVLCDMKEYGIVVKGGVKAAQSIHVQFTTEETAFRWSFRINGQPLWQSSLTPFKGSNTQSPFVALASRD